MTTYALSKPITVIDKELTELTLREPTGRDLRLAGDASAGQSYVMGLIARLADVPPSVIDDLPARDVIALGKIVSGFLGDTAPAP